MKKLSAFGSVIVLLFLSNYLISQQYYPFPTDTAKWSVYSRLSPWPPPPNIDTYQYFINGDTVIDLMTYSKIYSCIATYTEEIDTLNAIYLGGLREDGNKHIYFKPGMVDQDFSNMCYIGNNTMDEFLLYRFDVNPGDSFYLNEYAYYDFDVVDVDSVLVDQNYRRKLIINSPVGNGGYDEWIEGIGSEISLFGSICFIFEGDEHLLCYEDPSTFYFGEWNDSERCTDFIVGNHQSLTSSFRLYPNPVQSNESITIKGVANKPFRIELHDLIGKLHQQIEVESFPYNMRIRVPKGAYVLSIQADESEYNYQKVIVR